MSVITLLGGVEAGKAAELDQRLSDLSDKFDKLMSHICEIEQAVNRHEEGLVSTERFYNAAINAVHQNEERVGQLSNAVGVISHEWNNGEEQGMAKRVADLERMQIYLRASHGKMLNDIHDMKKELHDLYTKPGTPTKEEILGSEERNPENKELLDLIKEWPDYSDYRKGKLIATLKANNLTTLESISNMSFDDLCGINQIGPASAAMLVNIRRKYLGEINSIKPVRDIVPEYDIRSVVKEMDLPQVIKSRVINTLYKYGVNNLKDLRDVDYEEIRTIPNFGTKSVEAVKQIYNTYIWRQ